MLGTWYHLNYAQPRWRARPGLGTASSSGLHVESLWFTVLRYTCPLVSWGLFQDMTPRPQPTLVACQLLQFQFICQRKQICVIVKVCSNRQDWDHVWGLRLSTRDWSALTQREDTALGVGVQSTVRPGLSFTSMCPHTTHWLRAQMSSSLQSRDPKSSAGFARPVVWADQEWTGLRSFCMNDALFDSKHTCSWKSFIGECWQKSSKT